jgi:ABC-type transport system involved in cytochrome c biogenesis permease component
MIWYRHWLEIRWALLLLLALYLVFNPGSSNPPNALRWDVWFALPMHPFGPELSSTPLGEAIGNRIGVWATFAGRIPWIGFVTAWLLAGSGVQSLFHPRGSMAGNDMHTLTLPVSRARLVLTRYLSALALALALGLIVSAIGLAAFYLGGVSVPLSAIARSLALGFVYTATILAVGSALTAAMPRAYVGRCVVFFGLFLTVLVPVHYLVASPARGHTPWGLVGAFGLITALALTFTVRRVFRQEY